MYYILKMLSWLACRFPMKACLKLGNFLGKLTWLVVPEKRKKWPGKILFAVCRWMSRRQSGLPKPRGCSLAL